MDGTGTADLLDLSQSPLGYIRHDPGEGWTDRVRVGRAPAFDPNDPDLRLMDLDGDGLVDAIRSTSRAFYVFRNRGEAGWDPPYAIVRQHDLAVFPDVSFSDPRVKFADMTGDGLLDIIWVSGGRIDYWPALGGGRFGPRMSLSLHPSIAAGFEPERIYLADINGDGLADVAYLANDRVLLYVNRSGHSLVPAGEVLYPPRSVNAHIADILGSGLTGLLWSFPYSTTEPRNYKFLEFATGPRPYLLQSIDNGLGGNIGIEYQPSTEQALAAAERGQPWETTPPFAVQTVSRITQSDSVTGTVTSRQIRYYDGYFEGSEREFRGYGRAEVIEEGGASVPSTMTVSYFHQGRRGITPGATPEFRGALKGRLYRLEVIGTDSSGEFALHYRKEEDAYTVRQLAAGLNGRLVLFPSLATADVSTFEGGATSLRDKISLVYNDLGNIVEKHEVWDSGGGKQELHTFFRYTEDTVRWMMNLPVELMQQDAAGNLLVFRRYFYDGAPFVGLPLGQVVTGKLSRREEMAITNAQAASVYGAATPDFAAAGFHAITATTGATGWATNTVRQQHDAQGNSVAQMDAFGNTGHVVYDADGIFPVQVTDPSGRIFDAGYDIRLQELVRISDPNGHETRYHFDAIRRMTAMVKPGDSDAFPTISFDYQDVTPPFSVNTRLRKASGQAGMLDSIEYFDGFGKHLQTRSSGQNGGVLVDGVRTYNRRGWEDLRSVPRFSTAFAYDGTEGLDQPERYEFRYDPLGRITETVTPDARTSRIVYQLGEIIRYDVSDTDNSAENIARGHFDTPRREAYDARGRLLGLTETNTGGVVTTTQYQLDALGRLASITDARGVVTEAYMYDLMGRKIQVLHIDAGNRRVVYDARGDLTLRIDAEDRRIGMRYDELRRIAEITAGAVSVERYTYDAGAGQNLAGRLALVEDEAGQVIFSYTSRGLIERKRRTIGAQSFEVNYGYDALERLTSLTYPDASAVAFEYGDGGLLDRVPGFVSKLTWNAHAQLTQVNFVNGVTENYDFDPATFYLREALVTGPAGPLYNVTYSHDAVGNPLAIADQLPQGSHVSYSREFTYDALYQILNVQATAGATAVNQSYNYDPVGNFRQNGEFGGGAFFLEPGGSNRISGITQGGVDSILFGYDGDGNMVSSPGRTMQFDARGRLSRVARADGTVVDFTYAYTGERVRKRVTSSGQTSETIYIDNLYELRGNQVATHVLHQNRRLTTIKGGETRFLHPDHLGNIVLITNSTGDVVRQTGYLPFGTVAFSQGPAPSTRGFTGNEFDSETGLVFCGARYYDPALGRFISPDPFFLLNPEKTLATPGGLNL
jgi:RHS repeat-associated protein